MKISILIVVLIITFVPQFTEACNIVFTAPAKSNQCDVKKFGLKTTLPIKGLRNAECEVNAKAEILKHACEDYKSHGKCAEYVVQSCSQLHFDAKTGEITNGMFVVGQINMNQEVDRYEYCYEASNAKEGFANSHQYSTTKIKLKDVRVVEFEQGEPYEPCFPVAAVNQDQHTKKHDLKNGPSIKNHIQKGTKQ
jgi:hypothetical protein